MKKILSILFALFLSLAFTLPAFAADTDEWKETETWDASGSALTTGTAEYEPEKGSLLFDYAFLLTESERADVEEALLREGGRVGCDFAVLTRDYIPESDIRYEAESWYQEQGYANNGVLLVISIDDRNAQIVTHGNCRTVITDEAGVDHLFDLFTSDMSNGDWEEAFKNYASGARQMMEEYNDTGKVWKKPYNKIWILIAIGGGLIVAAIVTGNMKSKLKSVHYQTAAADYVVPGTMNLTNASDVFLYTSVTRTPRPKESSSSSRSGGSSSFGGGSRHF